MWAGLAPLRPLLWAGRWTPPLCVLTWLLLGLCVACVLIYFFFNYTFIFGRAGSLLLSGLFSSCSERGLVFVASLGFSRRGAQALEFAGFSSCALGSIVAVPRLQSTDSVVVGHRLRCCSARGIFPGQGSNPGLRHWQAESLLLNHQGSLHILFF